MIWQKINYIHRNPVKAGLVKSAKDYYWSSFRSFYSQGGWPWIKTGGGQMTLESIQGHERAGLVFLLEEKRQVRSAL